MRAAELACRDRRAGCSDRRGSARQRRTSRPLRNGRISAATPDRGEQRRARRAIDHERAVEPVTTPRDGRSGTSVGERRQRGEPVEQLARRAASIDVPAPSRARTARRSCERAVDAARSLDARGMRSSRRVAADRAPHDARERVGVAEQRRARNRRCPRRCARVERARAQRPAVRRGQPLVRHDDAVAPPRRRSGARARRSTRTDRRRRRTPRTLRSAGFCSPSSSWRTYGGFATSASNRLASRRERIADAQVLAQRRHRRADERLDRRARRARPRADRCRRHTMQCSATARRARPPSARRARARSRRGTRPRRSPDRTPAARGARRVDFPRPAARAPAAPSARTHRAACRRRRVREWVRGQRPR